MGNQVDKRFYVYEHRDADGEIFYIGKGSGDRAWKISSRNAEWMVRASSGFSVRIVKGDLLESCALCIERMLIATAGIDKLTNKAKGGASNSGWLPPQEYRDRLSKIMKGRPFPEAARTPEAMAKRRAKMVGRKLSEVHRDKLSKALLGGSIGGKEHDFYHPDHGHVRARCQALMLKYGLDKNVTALISGRIRSTKGWSLLHMAGDTGHRTADKHHASDIATHTFIHPKDGIFTGTRHEFAKAHNLKMAGIGKLVRGDRKSTAGWRIIT